MKSFVFDEGPFDLTGIGALIPVLRVRLVFETGSAVGFQEGSGFFLDVWTASIVTASHVISVPDGAHALRVELQVFGENGNVLGRGRSMAYPDGAFGRSDVGAVRLPMARPLQTFGMSTAPAPVGAFDAMIWGRANGALQHVPVSVTAENGLLAYRPADAGEGGMSGGPLRVGNRVVGIHLGQVRGMAGNGAAPADDDLLTKLSEAASAAEEGT